MHCRWLDSSTLFLSYGAAFALTSGVTGCFENSSSPAEAACVPDATVPDALAGDGSTLSGLPSPTQISLTTLYESPLAIEGLTGDNANNVYTAGQNGSGPCPVWRIAYPSGAMTVVGNLPAPCTPLGLAFDSSGALYVADPVAATIWKLTPSDQTTQTATAFATGVPGASGLAFDSSGKLWVTDGTTGQGRVWFVGSDGTVTESFRVQPLANSVNLVAVAAGSPAAGGDADPAGDAGPIGGPSLAADGGPEGGVDGGVPEAGAQGSDAATIAAAVDAAVGGVGRDIRGLPPGSLTITATTRTAANTAGSVAGVASGILVAPDGALLVADTARGAIWRVMVDSQGQVLSPVDCDTTFVPDTLCLQNLFVEHPILEGLDGIALDTAGNVWGVANERNAVVVVTPSGSVQEVFRNPPDTVTQLRNGGPLEFPTSPFIVGNKLCITQSDANLRDNYPNSGGEVGPDAGDVGKISCVDQPLPRPGVILPLQ